MAITARSLPFGDNKLRQAATCLASFRKSLGQLRVKIWVILDGCPPEYRALFEQHFAPGDLVFVEVDGIGNRATFERQIDILLSQSDAEFVYFAEDDYLYLGEQFPLMVDFLMAHPDADFVTPYDHPDCYHLELHREPKWLRLFGGHHWRTAASTCLTFLTRRRTLAEHARVFRTYAKRNSDCSLWLSLTKRKIYNPIAPVRYLVRGEMYWKVLVKAWLFCWPQIIFGRKARIWVPVPSIATHLNAEYLAPNIDWVAAMRDEESNSRLDNMRNAARGVSAGAVG